MSGPLLRAASVTKRFGGFFALDRVDLAIHAGERVGLIGPNGSGKSTLVNCITGTTRPSGGTIHFAGHSLAALAPHRRIRLGIARTFQIPRPFASLSVVDNLRIPLHYARHANARLSDDGDAAGLADDAGAAMAILERVGLAGKAHARSGSLTQVDMRKLELARAMAARPRLLISDESMAGLSTSEVDDILAILSEMKAQGIAVLLIEHVMRAVMRFSERIAVLVVGRKIADGAPGDVLANPDVERSYLGQ